MSKLKEIKQRCSMATPGPWVSIDHGDNYGAAPRIYRSDDPCDDGEWWNGRDGEYRDREFVCAARTDLPWAVGWIERASIELRVLRAICRSMPKPRLGEWDWPGIEGRVDKLLSELTGDK